MFTTLIAFMSRIRFTCNPLCASVVVALILAGDV